MLLAVETEPLDSMVQTEGRGSRMTTLVLETQAMTVLLSLLQPKGWRDGAHRPVGQGSLVQPKVQGVRMEPTGRRAGVERGV